ncbi:MAG TPA: mechanosensitive ion channel family protein, partial [Longimicrobium sp.]|nr:mechanosensitive ion channel family protein [Longimicrobium sp.]
TVTTIIRERARGIEEMLDWPVLAATGLRVLGALVVAVLAYTALEAILRRVDRSIAKGGSVSAQEQRARTLVSLLRSMGRVVVGVMTLFMVLDAMGVKLGALLAGAGVVGLALSFGAQSLVKDVIAGLFMLMENQFGVGDVIRIEGVSGTVEEMTLRVVVLRDVYGVVHVVPNGQIKKVSNQTRAWARVVLDVGVGYHEDPDRVMEVMRDEGRLLWEDPDWRPLMLEAVEVPGIESFAENAVIIRMSAKTLPLKQWEVARELRRRLKYRFDAEKIEMPTPQKTVPVAEGHALSEFAGQRPGAATAKPAGGSDDEQ